MDIKSISFERPALLRLVNHTVDITEESFDILLRELLEAQSETRVNCVLVRTDSSRVLYASSSGKAHKLELDDKKLAICFMTPAKGAGFISIATDWSSSLFEFGQVYGMLEMNEAKYVAEKLESLVGYPLPEKSYGADA